MNNSSEVKIENKYFYPDVRKMGSSFIITIDSNIANLLCIKEGDQLSIAITGITRRCKEEEK